MTGILHSLRTLPKRDCEKDTVKGTYMTAVQYYEQYKYRNIMRAVPYHKIATFTMTKSLWHKNNTVEECLSRKPPPPHPQQQQQQQQQNKIEKSDPVFLTKCSPATLKYSNSVKSSLCTQGH